VIIHNVLESIRLLADGCNNFQEHCVAGLEPDAGKMAEHLERGLMLVTALNPHIGYDKSAQIAKKAYAEGLTLREAALDLGYLTDAEFDQWVRPENMLEAGMNNPWQTRPHSWTRLSRFTASNGVRPGSG
jgi:fumarate hydratase class II